MNSMPIPSMTVPKVFDVPELRIYRGRPVIVQDFRATAGSLEVTLFWNAPQSMLGVDGWRIFQDDENNLIQEIGDRNSRQATVKIPGNSKRMFFICAVSAFGREGPKASVLANSDTNQIVSAGTSGGTSGNQGTTDTDWNKQPSGGRRNTF